jgi:alpha-L-fucosidase
MGQAISRRDCLQMLALSAGWAATPASTSAQETKPGNQDERPPNSLYERPAGHERRMAWWREAKFGMFIHFGLYSVLGRGEWVMVIEDIPIPEYEQLAKQFNPHPNGAREWARLAKQAGMKYMVMTTKHHDGFCLFDSHFTDYNAAKQAAGRDLVREYVDAVRAEGLRVGFYFSLMDWHSPDWAACKTDAAAARRFVDRVHAEMRQLMTEYGKIDELWYDGAYPFDAEGWRSPELNAMVFELQPDIVINNRSWMAGDFSTPEQSINAAKGDWESCMTLNDHWGYGAADDNWKSPRTLISNLVQCCENGGNYLLNIGPKGDGSVPEPSVRILEAVGKWIEKNGESLHGVGKSEITIAEGALFSKKGNTIYIYLMDWPGSSYTIGGISKLPKSAKYLATGKEVKTEVHGTRLVFSGLSEKSPDAPITVIVAEFDTAPVQDSMAVRIVKPFTKLIQDEVKMGWG